MSFICNEHGWRHAQKPCEVCSHQKFMEEVEARDEIIKAAWYDLEKSRDRLLKENEQLKSELTSLKKLLEDDVIKWTAWDANQWMIKRLAYLEKIDAAARHINWHDSVHHEGFDVSSKEAMALLKLLHPHLGKNEQNEKG